HAEMHLAIHEPVVAHPVHRAILEVQPNQIAFFPTILVHTIFVRGHSDIIFKTKGGHRYRRALESPAPSPTPVGTAGRPPQRIDSQTHAKREQRSPKENSAPENMNRALPKAETPRTNSWHPQTNPTRAHPTKASTHARRRDRHATRAAQRPPAAGHAPAASVPNGMLCKRRPLDQSKSQHADSNNQNPLEDR